MRGWVRGRREGGEVGRMGWVREGKEWGWGGKWERGE